MLILGAGPAGLACGIAAALGEKQVTVLEKNSQPGTKLRLAGAGQCNLTHGGSIGDFLLHYGGTQQSRFAKPALCEFPNTETVRFFEQRSTPLFEREDGKVFPHSLNGGDVLRVLTGELERNEGHLRTGIEIFSVRRTKSEFCVETNQGIFTSNRLAIATGGISYPQTGSTGDGYCWAEQFGHRIVPPRPGLTPVIVEDYPFANAAGISWENVPIDVFRNGKKIRQGCGGVLLTHRGLSGPGILDISRFLEPQDTLRLPICQSTADLESLLCGKKFLKNALAPLGVPDRLLQLLLLKLGIAPETAAAEVDRKTRHRLEQSLQRFPFVVKRLGGFEEAMCTCGGVALEEVKRQTMESRLVPGLFFCGEVLDVDGNTGGYNIQFALSSGFLAGKVP